MEVYIASSFQNNVTQQQSVTLKYAGWQDAGWGTSTAQTDDNEPTDGGVRECGDESEQERSRTGGGAGKAAKTT